MSGPAQSYGAHLVHYKSDVTRKTWRCPNTGMMMIKDRHYFFDQLSPGSSLSGFSKFVLILTDFESDRIKRMYINGPGLISLAVNTLTNGNRHLTLN